MIFRVSGGVLSYVLAISLLVSVVLSMLTLYVYYARMEHSHYLTRIRLQKNLASGIQMTLGEYDHFAYDQAYHYDLYGEEQDSINILRRAWGLLDLYRVTAYKGDLEVSRIYTLAHRPAPQGRSAVFLVDDGRPLSLVGDTRLIGDCFLPVSGVQSAYINRVGYTNDSLIYGQELKSEKKLPEVALKEAFTKIEKLAGGEAEPDEDTLTNSFGADLVQVKAGNVGVNKVYSGHVLITSNTRLVFDTLARTTDIVAYAPVIEFLNGFHGSGQFFATDTIIIHNNVKLTYPTVLATYNRDDLATIQTRGKCEIAGWILMDGSKDGFRRRVIYLEDGTQFHGMIYCNGMLETYGTVEGHVTVKRFLVNSQTGVYENYLFNATIDGTKLDTAFLALPQWFYKKEGKVLKYLN
ncbi:MAG: hypothetical protein RIC30_21725 [Marinoscillum sp.]|uniref:hypothetical protein n=1 Tax=Marinoscillum sp. TaxID=2024838 RepID=UPI0032FA3B70